MSERAGVDWVDNPAGTAWAAVTGQTQIQRYNPRMKILSVGTVLILAAALQVSAQQTQPIPKEDGGGKSKEGNCGLLYGKDHSLTFCAPDGWTLDNTIMNDQGVYAVFYPADSNWLDAKESGAFMYINVVTRAADSTVEKMMAGDAKDAKQFEPSAVVVPGEPIKIGDVSVPVQRFAPGGFKRYEAVAYVDQSEVLVMFIISSKEESLFKRNYPAFVKLVQSYKFLSSNVTIEHK